MNSDTSSIYDASVFTAPVVVSVLTKDFQSPVVSTVHTKCHCCRKAISVMSGKCIQNSLTHLEVHYTCISVAFCIKTSSLLRSLFSGVLLYFRKRTF